MITKIFELFKNSGKVFLFIILYFFLSYLLISFIASIVLMVYNFDVYRAGVLLSCDTNNIQSIGLRVFNFVFLFVVFIIITLILVFIAIPSFWISALWYFINPIGFNIHWAENLNNFTEFASFLLAIQFYGVDNGIGYTLEILTGFSILFIISIICMLIYFLFFSYKSSGNELNKLLKWFKNI